MVCHGRPPGYLFVPAPPSSVTVGLANATPPGGMTRSTARVSLPPLPRRTMFWTLPAGTLAWSRPFTLTCPPSTRIVPSGPMNWPAVWTTRMVSAASVPATVRVPPVSIPTSDAGISRPSRLSNPSRAFGAGRAAVASWVKRLRTHAAVFRALDIVILRVEGACRCRGEFRGRPARLRRLVCETPPPGLTKMRLAFPASLPLPEPVVCGPSHGSLQQRTTT